MKRIIAFVLMMSILSTSAYAMSVMEFVEVYNLSGEMETRKFWDPIRYDFDGPDKNGIMLLTYSYNGDKPIISVKVDTNSAANVKDMEIRVIYIMRRQRLSVSKYLEAVSLATVTVFSDVPEEKRLATIYRLICKPAFTFDDAKNNPFTVEEEGMGKITYIEESDHDLIMIELSEDK